LSHSAFTGISRHHLGLLVAELAGPWQARQESALRQRRGADRRRAPGAGRQHDQTALQTDGIDNPLQRFPDVRCEMDAGYRGLHRDHPGQVSVPPKKPAKDAAPELTQAWEQARHAQSSTRICVEHAIADSKNWRSLQRWTGRREYLPETIQAIGSLVSDRAAAR
jgi:hypothetical protein